MQDQSRALHFVQMSTFLLAHFGTHNNASPERPAFHSTNGKKMKRQITRLVAVLVFSLTLVGCATFQAQPFNREAHRDIKTIAVTPLSDAELQLFMLAHPAENFGLIGALVAAADIEAKEGQVERMAEQTNFIYQESFRAAFDEAMTQRGYTLEWSDPLMADRDSGQAAATKRVVLAAQSRPNAQAVLDIDFSFVGYAAAGAGDAQPYRPTVAVMARLYTPDGKVELFRDQILHNNFINNQSAIVIEPDPTYSYPDFGDLEAAGATIITGLEDAVRKSAQKLAEQL